MSGYEHIVTLPQFPEHQDKSPETARLIVTQWLGSFQQAVRNGSVDDLAEFFNKDAWIRDFLAFSWDFRTIQGSNKVSEYIKQSQDAASLVAISARDHGKFQPSFKTPAPGTNWVESMFEFETSIGRGKGMVRLVSGDKPGWKAYLINFTLQELKGAEERSGLRRPHGYVDPRGGTWGERRERQKEFLDEDPAVFVIGAGQAGLEIAVRLRHIGLPTLIIDKNERVGDNWRQRYRTLMTHDPIHYCHLPFIPFPSDWPMFVPKDKLADWLESYANIMELNVWNRTFVKTAEYDEQNKIWTITVSRQGMDRTLKPRHIVLATGQSGDPITPIFPGSEYFKGMLYHGINHKDATAFGDLSQKKVVVVGSGNSSHDICQNFYENGAAQVTMLQRGGTYVISVDKGVALQHAGIYDEGGPPTEDADIYAQSLPIPIQFALKVFEAQKISEVDKESLEGLAKAGFLVDSGPDKSGIFRKYITKGGGYYIDVGCSKLIIDGKIKVRQCSDGIKKFDADGIVLADGSRLDADIVVLATGYDGMRSTALRALGKKVADRLDDIWDLDEQGEIRSMWRSSGHPHFWCMGGNLALCRSYSRLLALQIKAVEEGLFKK
ncbi:hypothetical protein B0J15DRAFT_423922 [Fusarium solani]|uniref:Flavin-containing monooxygenase n=1 Tax=Fusarium solani TaxID=169388 RepID=A0A9P9KAZ2_FUSSL|nr:uncharacterized protein B0J15DRAFT_423922 [Fusarium solani]KAH7254563.1 hypothetical protein B0J15DRAFT_423922 [Fusarium solani]